MQFLYRRKNNRSPLMVRSQPEDGWAVVLVQADTNSLLQFPACARAT